MPPSPRFRRISRGIARRSRALEAERVAAQRAQWHALHVSFRAYHNAQRRAAPAAEHVKTQNFADALIAEVESMGRADANAKLKGFYGRLIAGQREAGICSLTDASAPDNELLWAHYGDEHRGICLAFTPDVLSRARPVLRRHVHYSGTGILDPIALGYLETFERLFSTKSLAWAYEQELRLFLYGTGHRALPISHRDFSAVILGSRFYATAGFDAAAPSARKARIARLAGAIRAINKTRQAGMKLQIWQVKRDLYRFAAQHCDTGRALDRMERFAAS